MGSHTSHNKWPQAMASRLGMGGVIDFTSTAINQTLHIPCSVEGGHIVDVTVAPRQHPDAVAKKLLAMGWTLGHRLKCPVCSRRKDVAKLTPEQRKARSVAAGKKRWEGIPAEERKSHMAALQLKAADKITKELPVQNDKPSSMIVTVDDSTVRTAVPAMSSEAKKAHRLVMQALEDYYDEPKQAYREGWTDKKVASEVSVSEASVAKVREEFFGPLGEPSELTDIKAMLAGAEGELRKIRARLVEHESTVSGIKAKLNRVCQKYAWAVAD